MCVTVTLTPVPVTVNSTGETTKHWKGLMSNNQQWFCCQISQPKSKRKKYRNKLNPSRRLPNQIFKLLNHSQKCSNRDLNPDHDWDLPITASLSKKNRKPSSWLGLQVVFGYGLHSAASLAWGKMSYMDFQFLQNSITSNDLEQTQKEVFRLSLIQHSLRSMKQSLWKFEYNIHDFDQK